MRTVTLLERQLTGVNQILHTLADDLTLDELVTRVLSDTNLLAFDLWHVARTQDWAFQTLARGVPEVIDDPQWQSKGSLATHGIGVGMTQAEADTLAHTLAHTLALGDLLAYADAVHRTSLDWLAALPDEALDTQPDVPAHLARYPIYLEAPMREEVPWMFEHPPLWRCFAPAIGHNRDHLAEMDLLKRQMRAQRQ
ncbi:MAG: DinB family protein [Ktedonobacterales bacterium]